MKRPLRYTFLLLIVVATATMPRKVLSQSSQNLFQDYGYEGLRYIGVDRLTDLDLLCDSSYMYQSRDSTTNEWILQEKALFRYDKQGREVSRKIYSYRDNKWYESHKILNTYNSEFLSICDEFIWDSDLNEWKPSVMHTYSYNVLRMVDEIKTYHFLDLKWVPNDKVVYFYNSDFMLDFESHYLWNEELNDWIRSKRTLYVYNDDEAVSKEVVQSWDDKTEEWVNSTSQSFTFDDAKNLMSSTISLWDLTQEVWVSKSSIFIDYHLAENPTRKTAENELLPENNIERIKQPAIDKDDTRSINEVVKSYWNETIGTWEMHQKQINYWTRHLKGNLQNSQKEIICRFANPYTIGLPWHCEFLKPQILYTLKIYDLSGRCFYTGNFYGASPIRIDKNLNPGFYIFEISGGLDKHSEKVYVKNK